MKWYWWTLIGVIVIVAIILLVRQSRKSKAATTVASNALAEGSPCLYNASARTAGGTIDLPISTVAGTITNGVCVPNT